MSKKRILLAGILSTVGCYLLLTKVWYFCNILLPGSAMVLTSTKEKLNKPIVGVEWIGLALLPVIIGGSIFLSAKYPEFDRLGEKFIRSIYFAGPLWLFYIFVCFKQWKQIKRGEVVSNEAHFAKE